MTRAEELLDELLVRAAEHRAAGLGAKAAVYAAVYEMPDAMRAYGKEMLVALDKRLAEMKLH